jgi:transposase InsO family protein
MVRMAEKNREWGYRRILGALSNLGYRIPRGTAGRNLTDAVDRILKGKCYLIHDHDPLFTAEFLNMLAETGVKSVKLPPYSPNLNAYAERFVRSIKESCLERMIFFGERALHKGVQEFVAHYHGERNHQGPGNRLIIPDESHAGNRGAIRRRERLGGMLHYYNRQAA